MTTGEIIKEMRERRGLSQEELAKAAGYKDRSMIAKIESGSSDPSQRMLKRLAQALEVSPSELLDSPKTDNKSIYENNPIFPKTIETRIVSANMDDLPQDDRELLLSMFQTMMRKRFPEKFGKDDEQ